MYTSSENHVELQVHVISTMYQRVNYSKQMTITTVRNNINFINNFKRGELEREFERARSNSKSVKQELVGATLRLLSIVNITQARVRSRQVSSRRLRIANLVSGKSSWK